MGRWTILTTLILVPVIASSQSPSANRPDTLGANVPQGGARVGTPDGFDFLVGEWDFVFQQKTGSTQPGAEWSAPISGTWSVRKVRDGLVVEDVWALSGASDPTLSWRVFNPSRQLWEMQGLKARRGSWDPGIAWGSGDTRFVEQTFTNVSQARIRYYRITPNSFSWRADVSVDGGKTWMRDAWLIEARRR
jgi:hypothetical protein